MLMSLPETKNKAMPETIEDVESNAAKKNVAYTQVHQEETKEDRL